MSVSYLRNNIINILNAYKAKNTYIVIPYTILTYTFLYKIQLSFIKRLHILHTYLVIEFIQYNKLKTNVSIKFFDCTNKKQYYTFKKLRQLKNFKGIIFTSKGLLSISETIQYKIGGILFCLIRI